MSRNLSVAVRRWLTSLLILTAVVFFHRSVIFREDTTFPWDFIGYHLPLATAYSDAISQGSLPLWDPYTYCGRPLLANPQTATFYPGMFLSVLPGRSGLLERLEWLAVFHIGLAGLFTYLLALRLRLSEPASLFAGLAFALGGFFVSQAQHLGMILSSPWLVLAWFAVLLPSRRRIPILAASWSMSFFAGFTAFTLMSVAATLLFAAGFAPRRHVIRDLGIAVALFIGMVLVQLGPSLELVNQSVAKYRTDWLGFGGGLPPKALLSLVLPNHFGVFGLDSFHDAYDPTHLYQYSGIATILFAIIGVWRRSFRMAGLLFAFLVLMLGEHTFVAKAIYWAAPEFLQRGIYWYVFLAPFLLSLVLLAGLGLQRWKHRLQLCACIVLVVDLTLVGANRPSNTQKTKKEFLVNAQQAPDLVEATTRLRDLAGSLRIDTAGDSLDLMSGAPILRWRAANGYDPLALERLIMVRLNAARGARWGAYYEIEQPDSPALDWMSVRVLLSRKPLNTSRLQSAGQVASHFVYLNPSALVRYRAANCVVGVPKEMPNQVDLDVDCQRPSILETSDPYYSAWLARIDGEESPISIVHSAFRSLPLPSGKHHVVFQYSTTLLAECMMISIPSWALCLLLLLRRPAMGPNVRKSAGLPYASFMPS